MHPNHMAYAQDILVQQYHQERCREELRLYENYCNERRRQGYQTGPPRFNEHGQITNLPHHFVKLLKYPRECENPPQQHGRFNGHRSHASYQNQCRQQVPQPQEQNQNFSICYTLSHDPNSPARQVFESFRNHALVPGNMTPSHVIFVFERSSNMHYRSPVSADMWRRDAAVGDYSVVRYDAETQTEWGDKEQPPSLADNAQRRRNKPIKTTTSNISEPDVPEFNLAVWKVAQWLHMTKSLEDHFNGSDSSEYTMSHPPHKVMTNACHPSPPLSPLQPVQPNKQQIWKLDAKAFEPASKLKVEVATTANEKPDTRAASCATEEQKKEQVKEEPVEKCSPPPSEPKDENSQ